MKVAIVFAALVAVASAGVLSVPAASITGGGPAVVRAGVLAPAIAPAPIALAGPAIAPVAVARTVVGPAPALLAARPVALAHPTIIG